MKKILILLSALTLLTSCEWFEFDNQEQYNAKVEGAFIDSKTGNPIQIGSNPNTFSIIQENYIAPGKDKNEGTQTQSWRVKFNGTYRNNLVWAGDYRVNSLQANYYPLTETFTLKKGSNTVNFTVTPYARVLDTKFSYNSANKTVTATFKVELAVPADINSVNVQLFGYSDRFVCDALNKIKDDGAKKTITVAEANGTTEISLTTSVASDSNQGLFMYDFDKFWRVGVCATGNGVNTNKRFNFSPTFKSEKGFAAFSEVTNWEE